MQSEAAKSDLLFRGNPRRIHVGRAEFIQQSRRQRVDQSNTVGLACLHDLHQGRPAERIHAEKAGAERAAGLALQIVGLDIGKDKGARHRPFAGLGGVLEYKCIRRIEPDGAQEFHVRGPLRLGIEPGRLGERGQQRMALGIGLAHAPHQEIAVLVDVAADAFSLSGFSRAR